MFGRLIINPMSNLLQNAVHILQEDIYVVSTHQHDYVTHVFKDVEPSLSISVDGGAAYARRASEDFLRAEPFYEEFCLTDEDTFEHIEDRLLWGTRGKDGKQPLTYRPIKELAARPDGISHLEAILANCPKISPMHYTVVDYWLNKQRAAQEVIEG